MVGQFGFGNMNGKLAFISGFMHYFRVKLFGQSNNGIHFNSCKAKGTNIVCFWIS